MMITKHASKKSHLNEIDVIRAMACLSVVLLHAIKLEVDGSGLMEDALLTISGLLAFGTAAFVSISAIILAYSYPDKLPSGFYWKRIKLIMLPFICMAAFYSIGDNFQTLSRIPIEFIYNIMGNYHGWFILVIFQFYLLYQLFINYFSKASPVIMLTISLVINVIYLGFFNFTDPPDGNVYLNHLWERWYWYPFFGWVFYFTLSYYIGKSYHRFLMYIKKYYIWILIAFPISITLIIVDNIQWGFPAGSKRLDMILFTVTAMFLLFLISSKIRNTPFLLDVISRYSFGIYLIHWSGLLLWERIFELLNVDFGYMNIILIFAGSVMFSIAGVYIFNMFPLGKYIIGRVKHRGTITVKPIADVIKSV